MSFRKDLVLITTPLIPLSLTSMLVPLPIHVMGILESICERNETSSSLFFGEKKRSTGPPIPQEVCPAMGSSYEQSCSNCCAIYFNKFKGLQLEWPFTEKNHRSFFSLYLYNNLKFFLSPVQKFHHEQQSMRFLICLFLKENFLQ